MSTAAGIKTGFNLIQECGQERDRAVRKKYIFFLKKREDAVNYMDF